jgi:hypothetical protein
MAPAQEPRRTRLPPPAHHLCTGLVVEPADERHILPFVPKDLRPLAGRQKEIRDANNYRPVCLRNSRAAGVHLRKWPNRA